MRILEFEIDDENLDHMSRHGIEVVDLDAFLAGRITVRRNKRASGTYRLRGIGLGGLPLELIVVETACTGRWRPITGWRYER